MSAMANGWTAVAATDTDEYDGICYAYYDLANGGLSMTELNDVKGWLTEDDIAVIQDVYAKLGQDAIDLPEV